MTPADDFRERVRRLRERRRWSQAELADRVHFAVNQSVISKIESGERKVTIDEAFELARAFEVEPAALIAPPKPSPEDISRLLKKSPDEEGK
jgi:transcriptional regulator with XRE-family HTH domain